MSLYDNISAYEQISSMYPKWYLDVYEMRELIRIESLISTQMQKAIDLILDNHFIDTISEKKAIELEKFLNIKTSPDKTLEERRAIIKTYFLGRGKLSMNQIEKIVDSLTGGKCSGEFLTGDHMGNQYINLKIRDCDVKGMIVDVIKTLKARVPAHLWVTLQYTPRRILDKKYLKMANTTTLNGFVSCYGRKQASNQMYSYTGIVINQSVFSAVK